jgi:hypothetical protein
MNPWPGTLALAIALTGCAANKQFDTAHVGDVQNGAQDKDQVTQWFGDPHQIISPLRKHPAGCVERWQWTWAHSLPTGESVANALVVDFDKDGKVCDHGYKELKQ